jgi:hypothetical protein
MAVRMAEASAPQAERKPPITLWWMTDGRRSRSELLLVGSTCERLGRDLLAFVMQPDRPAEDMAQLQSPDPLVVGVGLARERSGATEPLMIQKVCYFMNYRKMGMVVCRAKRSA